MALTQKLVSISMQFYICLLSFSAFVNIHVHLAKAFWKVPLPTDLTISFKY